MSSIGTGAAASSASSRLLADRERIKEKRESLASKVGDSTTGASATAKTSTSTLSRLVRSTAASRSATSTGASKDKVPPTATVSLSRPTSASSASSITSRIPVKRPLSSATEKRMAAAAAASGPRTIRPAAARSKDESASAPASSSTVNADPEEEDLLEDEEGAVGEEEQEGFAAEEDGGAAAAEDAVAAGAEIEMLRDEIGSLQEALANAEEERVSLVQQLASASGAKDATDSVGRAEEAEARCRELQRELGAVRAAASEASSVKGRVESADAAITALNTELLQLKTSSSAEIAQLSARAETAESERAVLQEQVVEMRKVTADIGAARGDADRRREEAESELARIKQRMAELEAAAGAGDGAHAAAIAGMQQSLAEADRTHKAQLERALQAEKLLAEVTARADAAEVSLNEAVQRAEEARIARDKVAGDLAVATSAADGLQRETQRLRADLEAVKESSTLEVEAVRKEMAAQVAAARRDADAQVIALHAEIAKLKIAAESASASASAAQPLKEEASTAKAQVRELQQELTAMKREHSALKTALDAANKRIASLDKLTAAKDAAEQRADAAESRARELQDELDEASAKLESMELDMEIMREELDDAKATAQIAEASAASGLSVSAGAPASDEVSQLRDALRRLHEVTASEKQELQRKIQGLTTACAKLPQLQERAVECESLRAALKKVNEDNEELKEMVDAASASESLVTDLTDKLLSVEEERNELHDRVAELEEYVAVSRELEENFVENEKRLKIEATAREDLILQLESKVREISETLRDREKTSEHLRATVVELQRQADDLAGLKEDREKNADELSEQSRSLVSRNMTLVSRLRAAEAKCNQMDVELVHAAASRFELKAMRTMLPRSFAETELNAIDSLGVVARVYFKTHLVIANLHTSAVMHTDTAVSEASAAFQQRLEGILREVAVQCRRIQAASHCRLDPSKAVALCTTVAKYNTQVRVMEDAVDSLLRLQRREQLVATTPLDGLEHPLATLQAAAAEVASHETPSTDDDGDSEWWEACEMMLRMIASVEFDMQVEIALLDQRLGSVPHASPPPQDLALLQEGVADLRQQSGRLLRTVWDVLGQVIACPGEQLLQVDAPPVEVTAVLHVTQRQTAECRDVLKQCSQIIAGTTEADLPNHLAAVIESLGIARASENIVSAPTSIASRLRTIAMQLGSVHLISSARSGGGVSSQSASTSGAVTSSSGSFSGAAPLGAAISMSFASDVGLVLPSSVELALDGMRAALGAANSVQAEAAAAREALREKAVALREKEGQLQTAQARIDVLEQRLSALRKREEEIAALQEKVGALNENLAKEKRESEQAMEILEKELQSKTKELQQLQSKAPPSGASVGSSGRAAGVGGDPAETAGLRSTIVALRNRVRQLESSAMSVKLNDSLPCLESMTPSPKITSMLSTLGSLEQELRSVRATPALSRTSIGAGDLHRSLLHQAMSTRNAAAALVSPVS